MHVDLVEGRDERVHVDDRHARFDHLLDRRLQRADTKGLDGDEVPFLVCYVFDCGKLLGVRKRAIKPGHLDVEELAPVFGRLLALGAPTYLQTNIGERGLQRFLGPAGCFCHFGGARRRDPEST